MKKAAELQVQACASTALSSVLQRQPGAGFCGWNISVYGLVKACSPGSQVRQPNFFLLIRALFSFFLVLQYLKIPF